MRKKNFRKFRFLQFDLNFFFIKKFKKIISDDKDARPNISNQFIKLLSPNGKIVSGIVPF